MGRQVGRSHPCRFRPRAGGTGPSGPASGPSVRATRAQSVPPARPHGCYRPPDVRPRVDGDAEQRVVGFHSLCVRFGFHESGVLDESVLLADSGDDDVYYDYYCGSGSVTDDELEEHLVVAPFLLRCC